VEIQDIRSRWNREAKAFDDIYGSHSRVMNKLNSSARKAVLQRFQLTQKYLAPRKDGRVLDVGSGSGVYAEAFIELPIDSYTGVDIAEQMLALATKRIASSQHKNKAEFVLADFMHWQTEETFDYVIAMGVFDYSSSPEPLVQKMASLARERIAFSLPTKSRFRLRSTLRRLRYLLFSKGDVYYYLDNDVERLIKASGGTSHSIEDLGNGQGFFVVIDMK